MFKTYLALTKPGIIMGNLIAATAGYLLAVKGDVSWDIIAVMLGTSLIVASGCVFNNYVDQDIDQHMLRTQYRLKLIQKLGKTKVLSFGFILGLLGALTLYFFTNVWALFFGILGFFVYVNVYTLKYKRNSTYGTLIGSLSGACPPIIGYVAVTNQFDVGALILLATFCFWQIPHSYAIAIYRFDDYKAAKIPVLPIERGIAKARQQMILYIIAFAIAASMLAIFGYTSGIYALVMGVISMYWLYLAKVGYKPDNEKLWAKKVFLFSIIAIVAFSVLISTDFAIQNIGSIS